MAVRAFRNAMVLLAAAVTGFCASAAFAGADPSAVRPGDMSLGNPRAKITVVEYASVGCPICAVFNNTVFPEFKKKYVDTGQVRYVVREALTGNPILAEAGFLLARCAGEGKYFQVTDAIFRAQSQIFEPGTENVRNDTGRQILFNIADKAGVKAAKAKACLTDEGQSRALHERVRANSEQDDVLGTPTFFVNDYRMPDLDHPVQLRDLDAAIEPYLPRTKGP
jgi:protein-disulfide isomerase